MLRKKGVKTRCVKCGKKQFIPTTPVNRSERFHFECPKCGQDNVMKIEVVRQRIDKPKPSVPGRDEVPPTNL